MLSVRVNSVLSDVMSKPHNLGLQGIMLSNILRSHVSLLHSERVSGSGSKVLGKNG